MPDLFLNLFWTIWYLLMGGRCYVFFITHCQSEFCMDVNGADPFFVVSLVLYSCQNGQAVFLVSLLKCSWLFCKCSCICVVVNRKTTDSIFHWKVEDKEIVHCISCEFMFVILNQSLSENLFLANLN